MMDPLFFDQLFTGSEWLRDVRLDVDRRGTLASVRPGAKPEGCRRFAGCGLPGIPNLHSHAHQRAMAGLAERSGAHGDDSFWTWRRRMYAHVAAMSPAQLEAIAAQLYVEMLEAGYTTVCEFQYLHHDPDGRPYSEIAEMSLRCLAAAREVGIGFVGLPVFYAHGGFGAKPPAEEQRRFVSRTNDFLRLVEELRNAIDPVAETIGIAPHSLRAVSPEQLTELAEACAGHGPIHIHVAEQLREVEECLASTGRRPVEWLLGHLSVDPGWCLIHATHLNDEELRDLVASGAVAGLCPTTEANLGDGVFSAVGFLARGGRIGIGSDSHISTSPVEELRWLEYSQRLRTHQRNVLSGGPGQSTARRLIEAVLTGGAQASGRAVGAIAPGHRADLVVLETRHPVLVGRDGDELLDSWIFSGNSNCVRDVFVGGRQVVREGRHPEGDAVFRRYERTVEDLRKTAP